MTTRRTLRDRATLAAIIVGVCLTLYGMSQDRSLIPGVSTLITGMLSGLKSRHNREQHEGHH